MKILYAAVALPCLFLLHCDPDTKPVGGAAPDSDAGADASGGSAGSAGSGGQAGAAGGTAGSGGQAGESPDASDDGQAGAAGEAGAAGAAGGSTGYSHSITMDGTNDFDPTKDKFTTSSMSYSAYVAWDRNFISFGMEGEDVGKGDSNKWVFVYLGVDESTGTNMGIPYGSGTSQQPTLPFKANYHLRWKADGSYTNAQVAHADGTWTDAEFASTVGVGHSAGSSFVELQVTRLGLGMPSKVKVHINMINEQAGGEWTYAGAPSTTFSDGVDPNYTKYFEFDLSSTTPPAQYPILP